MEISFKGKRALVTGASRGIGRGIAVKLSQLGADVVAIGKTQSNLDDLKCEVPSIETVAVDLADWNKTAKVLSELGVFDCLVNSAGILHVQPLGDISAESFDRIFAVNVRSMLNISQMVANEMKKSGKGGSIVNISSTVGSVGFPTLSIYSSTKGAVDQLTKCLAIEYGQYNIRVNSVAPAIVNTDMSRDTGLIDTNNPVVQGVLDRSPLCRFGEVKDIVGPVIFYLSDMSSWITGSILNVDGGYTAL